MTKVGKFKRTLKTRKLISDRAKKRIAEKNPNWRGGRLIKKNKYIIVYSPHHPYASKDKYVLEHRLIMEKHIGRFLLPKERVHHINFNVQDNRIENLMLFNNQSDHVKFEYSFIHKNKKGQFTKRREKCHTKTI